MLDRTEDFSRDLDGAGRGIEPPQVFMAPADFALSTRVFQPTHFLCFTETFEYPGGSIHAVL
jgi:hypothetical protein